MRPEFCIRSCCYGTGELNANNSLRLVCPKCSAAVRAAERHAGKRLKCPRCGGAIKVPGAAPAANDDDQWFDLNPATDPAKTDSTTNPAKSKAPAGTAKSETRAPAVPAGVPSGAKTGQQTNVEDLLGDLPPLTIPGARTANKPSSKPVSTRQTDAANYEPQVVGDDWMDDLPPLTPVPSGRGSSSGGSANSGSANSGSASGGGPLDDLGLPGLSPEDLKALGSAGAFDAPATPARQAARPPADTDDLVLREEPESTAEYRAKCPVCESVHHVAPKLAGKQMHCGDCHSYFIVPPPPKPVKKVKIDLERAQTFQFSNPVEDRKESVHPGAKSAAAYLQAAEDDTSVEVDPRKEFEPPDVAGWFRETFRVFRDPAVLAYYLGLSLLGALPGVALVITGSPVVLLPGIALGILFISLVLICAFAILEAVANGQDRVDEWPSFNPVEWMGSYFVVFIAFVLSGAPGAIISWLLFSTAPLLSLATIMLSLFAFFPFVLLSILDNDSVFAPISTDVTKSVSRCPDAWGTLYFSSMLLFGGLFLLDSFFYALATPVLVAFVLPFLTVSFWFIYFAMLGRLAFSIGQAINGEPRIDD
ncbi:hypothetical protein SH139x_001750 [Planctomycetaceae bacterium SH139]